MTPALPPDDVADPHPSRLDPPWKRRALFALGWLFVPVGIAGVFLPVLPGTPLLIVAAACFARSSPRFEAWLVEHPRFGPAIRGWRATGTIPLRAKLFAWASLAGSWLLILNGEAPTAVKAGLLLVFLGVAAYLWSKPSR